MTMKDLEGWFHCQVALPCPHMGEPGRGYCKYHSKDHCEFCCGYETALLDVEALYVCIPSEEKEKE